MSSTEKPSKPDLKSKTAPKMGRQLSFTETLPIGSKQREKLKSHLHPRLKHGAELSQGKRKTSRPFIPNTAMHLVLKATRAKGAWSLLHRKNKASVNASIYTYAERFKVHVYRASNVGNHIHLLVKAKEKKQLADFLRVLTGQIACRITGARKGIKKIGKFWDYLYFSRVVNWGRDFYQVHEYLVKNLAEAHSPSLRKEMEDKEHPFWKHIDLGNLFEAGS